MLSSILGNYINLYEMIIFLFVGNNIGKEVLSVC